MMIRGLGSVGLREFCRLFLRWACLSVETDGRVRVQLGDGRFEVPGASSVCVCVNA